MSYVRTYALPFSNAHHSFRWLVFALLATSVQTRVLRRRGTVGRRPAGAARNCARCAAGSRAAGAEGGRGLGALKLAGPRIEARRSIFT
jgi:hypothetical protein